MSRSFREALAESSPARAVSIRPAGVFTDANVRTHELFAPDPASALRRRKILAVVGAMVLIGSFAVLVYFHENIRHEWHAGQPATLAFDIYPDGDIFVDGVARGKSPPLASLARRTRAAHDRTAKKRRDPVPHQRRSAGRQVNDHRVCLRARRRAQLVAPIARLAIAMSEMLQLGRYKILGELGRGAMGIVYRAQDPVLDRQLAIKTVFVPADDADRREYEVRFTQEARAAGKLGHPGIVTIYDVGREGEVVYMAMELLEGVDLGAQAETQRFPVPEAVGIVERVADALAFAHDRGVVHRDIKPPNIMLVGRGRIKIMDFGIARMRSSDLKTQTGLMMGTPRYMSPEQVAGRTVDQRSDIFSLGTVLYELLTGTKLFAAEDATEIMYNVSRLRPVPPSRINRQVPAMLDLVVAKALEKDVGERYQDAHQFAADLRACLNELGVQRADTETTQRIDRRTGAARGDDDKTEKLHAGDADATYSAADVGYEETRRQAAEHHRRFEFAPGRVAHLRFLGGAETSDRSGEKRSRQADRFAAAFEFPGTDVARSGDADSRRYHPRRNDSRHFHRRLLNLAGTQPTRIREK